MSFEVPSELDADRKVPSEPHRNEKIEDFELSRRLFLKVATGFTAAIAAKPTEMLSQMSAIRERSDESATELSQERISDLEAFSPVYIEGINRLRRQAYEEEVEFSGIYKETDGVGIWVNEEREGPTSGWATFDSVLPDVKEGSADHVRFVHIHPLEKEQQRLSPPSSLDMAGSIQISTVFDEYETDTKDQAVDERGVWTCVPTPGHKVVEAIRSINEFVMEQALLLGKNESFKEIIKDVDSSTDPRTLTTIISENEDRLDREARLLRKKMENPPKKWSRVLDEAHREAGIGDFDTRILEITRGSGEQEDISEIIKELIDLYAHFGFKVSFEPLPAQRKYGT